MSADGISAPASGAILSAGARVPGLPGSCQSSSTNCAWHVVRLQPAREEWAKRNLAAQGFDTFIPRMKVTLRRGNRLVDSTKPLFPGYGFVRFDGSAARWRSINGTRGVRYLVSDGRKPSAIPNAFINRLLDRSDDSSVIAFDEMLEVGDRVELMTGPFARQIGTLVRLQPGGRIKLLLGIISGEIMVEVNASSARRSG